MRKQISFKYILLRSLLRHQHKEGSLVVFWWLLVVSVIILGLRELFQLSVSHLSYLRSKENFMELLMLGSTCAILIHWNDPTSVRHLCALAVLLAWVEELFLLGRHPKLSVFVTMFTTVSITFLRLLLWFSVLLVGFAFSFFLVLNPVSNNDESDKGFQDVQSSLLKVYAMMVGELDFGALPFDANPWTSRSIFLGFLFLVTIVLLNLLNGIAVSDTQSIQNEVN